MKHLIFSVTALVMLAFAAGCSKQKSDNRLKVACGIPPVSGIVEFIGGDRVNTICVLPQGRTPHDFTPRNDTIRETSGAAIFFTTGMPFENKIAGFLKNRAAVCDVSRDINRIAFHDGGDHDHRHHDGCTHDDHDPHVWLSPENAIIIAGNIKKDLTEHDPEGKEYYQKNFDLFKEKMILLNRDISQKLSPFAGQTFFVYHPAFGYFAHAYKLKQRAIELNGREASPAQLAAIIREAKLAGVSTVFVQEQFNPRSAEALARQINGRVASLDPLAKDLPGNLRKTADAIYDGFTSKKE
ncbi:MAG: ABC transporter substrate-binding protein [Lentisphaerae bacterium]|nr:ABC transporter substrate-binding protein [Lentisphaerota bacterium]